MGSAVGRQVSAAPKPAKRGPRPRKRIVRKARPRKQRKSTLAALKRKLWELFRMYVRKRDGNTCFSCGHGGLAATNWHAGHMFPAGGSSLLRYEPKNVHSQCYRCNVNLAGNGAAYAAHFLDVYGLPEFERLSALSRRLKAWRAPEIEALIAAIQRSGADYELAYAELYGLP